MLVTVLAVGVAVPYARVALAADGRLHHVSSQPAHEVAIVFGAGVHHGEPSAYLRLRLEGARELWDAGKLRAILVSGTTVAARHYDEPGVMRSWLIAHGVPASVIVTDGAGNSTEDTCERAREVYGITRAVAVTQDYHVRRAVFTCQRAGIEITGLGVHTPHGTDTRDLAREVSATINAGWGSPLRKGNPLAGPPDHSIQEILRNDGGAPSPDAGG